MRSRAAGQDQLLHADLLLGVERHGTQLSLLGDRHLRIGHAPVVRAGGGEYESLHAGVVGVGDERSRGLHVDLVGDRGIERARRVADDRSEVHDGVHAGQRPPARIGVADVRTDHLDATAFLLCGDVLLAVKQRVEYAHLASALAQLSGEERTDIAAAAGDQSLGAHLMFPLWSIRDS